MCVVEICRLILVGFLRVTVHVCRDLLLSWLHVTHTISCFPTTGVLGLMQLLNLIHMYCGHYAGCLVVDWQCEKKIIVSWSTKYRWLVNILHIVL